MSADDIRLILHRLDEHSEKLDEVIEQAKLTNGRIKRLELWQAGILGAAKSIAWLPPIATSVITALVVYALTS
jgi:hypothetical protein